MEWVGNYDGEMADLKMRVNDNGNEKTIDVKLDNDDIIHLLNIPSNQYSLDERIRSDFLHGNNNYLPMIELPENTARGIKNKTKGKSKKRKSKRKGLKTKSKNRFSKKLFNLL